MRAIRYRTANLTNKRYLTFYIMFAMSELIATFTSKGQLVVPAALRRKYGIQAGTKVRFLEDPFGRIILQPITEQYIDRVMGCLAGGSSLLDSWEKEHRIEGERDK